MACGATFMSQPGLRMVHEMLAAPIARGDAERDVAGVLSARTDPRRPRGTEGATP